MEEGKRDTILVVDDTEANIDILVEALNGEYNVSVATDGESAIEAVEAAPPDLILLDIVMPGMDGYRVCRHLKSDTRTIDIPVIFLSSMGEIENKTKGFEMGAVDYMTKPFEIMEVKARVKTHLTLKTAKDFLAKLNVILESRVKERTKELALTQEVTIQSLATLAETRDNETGGHIRRTQKYVKLLAEKMCDHPRFWNFFDVSTIDLLYQSAPLHDIGRVGIRDNILLKPGKLTDDEFEEMKKHTMYGRDSLLKAEEGLGTNSFLSFAREVAYTHHEKWDGTGYPEKLSGENIPVSGRIMAVADVYDALISRRVYRPPLPHSNALEIISEGRGTHFDPDIADTFINFEDKFRNIALIDADFDDEREALSEK